MKPFAFLLRFASRWLSPPSSTDLPLQLMRDVGVWLRRQSRLGA